MSRYTFIKKSQWSTNFSLKWSQTCFISKIMFSISMCFIVLQIAAITCILYSTHHLTCQEPFRLFLIVHAIRSLLCTPFSIYLHFGYKQLSEYDDQDDINIIQLEHTRKALQKVQHGIHVWIVIWFLFGNYLVFFNSNTTTCDLTAKAIYDLSYAIVLYGYVLVTLPIFYSISTFLLMPCFIHVLQIMHIVSIDGESQGMSSLDIISLPLFHFQSTHPSIPNKRDQFCVICLSDYHNNQIICKLWCQHHFHKKCIFEWLKLNARCPLCKRDCRHFSDTEKKQLLPM